MGLETENDEIVSWDPVEGAQEPGNPVSVIPTAKEQCDRIARERAAAGRAFREAHPELVDRLAALLSGATAGTSVFVNNSRREYNVDEVVECLAGLGYEVKLSNAMVQNPYGAFRIIWYPDDKAAPELA